MVPESLRSNVPKAVPSTLSESGTLAEFNQGFGEAYHWSMTSPKVTMKGGMSRHMP
jgi:hypothetical protein